jgi:hypothetical protein
VIICAGQPGGGAACSLPPERLVIGSDHIEGQVAIVVAGACALHLRTIQKYLSVPLGAWDVNIEAAPLVYEELQADGPVFQLEAAVA